MTSRQAAQLLVAALLATFVAVVVDAAGRRQGRNFVVAVISLDLLVASAVMAVLAVLVWRPKRTTARINAAGVLVTFGAAVGWRIQNGQLQPATKSILAVEVVAVALLLVALVSGFAGSSAQMAWRPVRRMVGSAAGVLALTQAALPASGPVREARAIAGLWLVVTAVCGLASAPRARRSMVSMAVAVVGILAVVLRLAVGGDGRPALVWALPLVVVVLGSWVSEKQIGAVRSRWQSVRHTFGEVRRSSWGRILVWRERRSARRAAPAPLRSIADLNRTDRLVGGALALLTIGGVFGVTAWARHQGWYPIGDEGILVGRALDVGTSRTPLLGMPTTLGPAGPDGLQAHHPGPFLFWWYAPFVRVLGTAAGVMTAAATLALVATAVGVWAAYRARGRGAALAAWVYLIVVMLVPGARAPFDALNAFAPLLSLAALLLLAWAAASGVAAALPWAALMASICIQAYLPLAPTAALALLFAWGFVMFGPTIEKTGARSRALLTSVGVLLVLWSAPLYEAIGNRGGNPRELVAALGGGTDAIGWPGVWRSVARLTAVPPPWVRPTSYRVDDPFQLLSGGNVTSAVVVMGLGWWCWRRWAGWDLGLHRLVALGTLVLISVGLSASRLPTAFVFSYQIGWITVVGAFGCFAVATLAASDLPLWAGVPGARRLATPIRGALVVALIGLLSTLAWPGELTSYSGVAAWTQRSAEVLAQDLEDGPGGDRPIAVVADGRSWEVVIANSVSMSLVDRGRSIRVAPLIGQHWGTFRLGAVSPADPVLIVSDGFSPGTPVGRLIARTTPTGWSESQALATASEVATWARAHGPVTVRPGFDSLLEPAVTGWEPGVSCARLGALRSGEVALDGIPDGAIAQLYLEGVVAEPVLPARLASQIERDVLATPTELWLTDGAHTSYGANGPVVSACR